MKAYPQKSHHGPRLGPQIGQEQWRAKVGRVVGMI